MNVADRAGSGDAREEQRRGMRKVPWSGCIQVSSQRSREHKVSCQCHGSPGSLAREPLRCTQQRDVRAECTVHLRLCPLRCCCCARLVAGAVKGSVARDDAAAIAPAGRDVHVCGGAGCRGCAYSRRALGAAAGAGGARRAARTSTAEGRGDHGPTSDVDGGNQ